MKLNRDTLKKLIKECPDDTIPDEMVDCVNNEEDDNKGKTEENKH